MGVAMSSSASSINSTMVSSTILMVKWDLQYSFKRDLSDSERQFILKSWPKLKGSGGALGLQMVMKIISMNLPIKKLFGLESVDISELSNDLTVAAHSGVFEKFLDTIVCNIAEDFLLPYLKKVGSEHFYRLGPQVTESMWLSFAECMLSVILAKIHLLEQLQHKSAWRKVFTIIAHHMRLGYEEASLEYKLKYG